MAVGRIKGRCSFVRAFEGRWRSGIEGGGRRGRTGEGGGCRVVVHTGGPREETGAALGVLRMEPTGRRVEVGGDATWVEATTSKSDFRFTCYTSASSTSPPSSDHPTPFLSPILDRVRVPSRIIPARSLSRCRLSLIRYMCRSSLPLQHVSSTLAYFAQSVHTTGCTLVASLNQPYQN